jgi:Polyketide cyclase / dehydrase and lipid transport
MLKLIIIALFILTAAILIYAASRPNKFRIERFTLINASPEAIFAQLNDFHAWEAWSPWEKIDPAVKRSYTGVEAGVGAKYGWAGNRELGAGSMEIIQSTPHSSVLITIEFLVPFKATNTIEFTLSQEGSATRVSEAMYGPSPFVSKLMGLIINMDNMVGSKFDEGLSAIKAIVETPET